jgi:hypothetical protein
VHYPQEVLTGVVDREVLKEAIQIPQPASRQISQVEKLLAVIMSPRDIHTAQMHGLVGKPLLYVA